MDTNLIENSQLSHQRANLNNVSQDNLILQEIQFITDPIMNKMSNTNSMELCSASEDSHRSSENSSTTKIRQFKSYSPTNSGPFIVHVTSKDQSIGNIHPIKIGKLFYESRITNIEEIRRVGYNKLELRFRSHSEANEFLQNDILQKNNLNAFIPFNKLFIEGVIKNVDLSISTTEIVSLGRSAVPVVNAMRFNRRVLTEGKVEYVPTNTVKITFLAEQLPQHLYLYSVRFLIDRYSPPIHRCTVCQKFGHRAKFCRNPPKCDFCADNHITAQCNNKDSDPKCSNCSLKHAASSPLCMVLASQRRINKIRTDLNLSYREARQTLEGNTSYSQVLFGSSNNPGHTSQSNAHTSQLSENFNSTRDRRMTSNKRPKIHESNNNNQEYKQLWINPNGRTQSSNATVIKQPTSSQPMVRIPVGVTSTNQVTDSTHNSQLEQTSKYFQTQFDKLLKNKDLTEDLRESLRQLKSQVIPLIKVK